MFHIVTGYGPHGVGVGLLECGDEKAAFERGALGKRPRRGSFPVRRRSWPEK